MLQKGDKAPDFNATDQNGNEISISKFAGKKIVLYFYPKDDTPGCTAQACNLRDNYKELIDKNYVVIGVSPDDMTKHQKFTQKYELPFSLIPDPDKEIINKYNVWGKKKFMGKEYFGVIRTTYVIDENGIIEDIITKVKTKDHTAQII
ncbi:MAG: thioredoxin-dependent thiol peroxidase [Bacteroidales bacterium]